MASFLQIFVLLLLLTGLHPARAEPPAPVTAGEPFMCQCGEKAFEKRWQQADVVFAGRVKNIKESDYYFRFRHEDPPVAVTLSVDEIYKGLETDETEFELHTSLTKYTCTGHPFEQGKLYLVFAYQRDDFEYIPESLYRFPGGTYDTAGLCGGTKLFVKAKDDLKKITTLLRQ